MHAAIEPAEAGVVRLIDLGTSEGTKVNGEPVDKNTNISVGDMITIGPYTIRCQNSEAEEANPDEANPEEANSEEANSEEANSEEPASDEPTIERLAELVRHLETVTNISLLQSKADAWDILMEYMDSEVLTPHGLKGVIWALRRGLDKS